MVFTFSTKTKKPEDTRLVQELKDQCEETGQNFSALVVRLLKEYADERSN
jgi:hypothetical protein